MPAHHASRLPPGDVSGGEDSPGRLSQPGSLQQDREMPHTCPPQENLQIHCLRLHLLYNAVMMKNDVILGG